MISQQKNWAWWVIIFIQFDPYMCKQYGDQKRKKRWFEHLFFFADLGVKYIPSNWDPHHQQWPWSPTHARCKFLAMHVEPWKFCEFLWRKLYPNKGSPEFYWEKSSRNVAKTWKNNTLGLGMLNQNGRKVLGNHWKRLKDMPQSIERPLEPPFRSQLLDFKTPLRPMIDLIKLFRDSLTLKKHWRTCRALDHWVHLVTWVNFI